MARFALGVMGAPVLARRVASGAMQSLALSRGSRRLVACLAMRTARGTLTREGVADLMWPDCTAEQSRSRLSSALWRLRKSVGPELVQEGGGRIGLFRDGSVAVDIWELQRLAAPLRDRAVEEWQNAEVAALEAAMQARRGPFLDEVEGEWVPAARQSCADAYEFALECLMRFHHHRGHPDRSIAAARSLVRHDPYREDIHAALIELYTEKGQRSRALAQYTLCCDRLKSELGVAPGDVLRRSLARALGEAGPSGRAEMASLMRDIDRSMERLTRQVSDLRQMLEGGEDASA